jgi:hypothetical protein
MQTRLKIALAAAGFALAASPAFAGEMPTDGSKNFSPPSDAPSYFTNETTPEPARIDRQANFTSEDVAAVPDAGPTSPVATEPEQHSKHASAHRSARHAAGKSRGHGGPAHYAKANASKPTRTAAVHGTPAHTNSGSRSGSAAKSAGRGGMQAGGGKPGPTKHARTGTRQHASAMPSGISPAMPVA